MRYTVAGLALLTLAGCADSKWNFLRNNQDSGRAGIENPTQGDLLAYLNRNAQQVRSIRCDVIAMDTRMRIQQVNIGGKMICEKPRNFRLFAEALGATEADIGSNDREFWYYIKRNDPPMLVTCSYQDLQNGAKIPFPFQPEWVMEALGMAEYNPADNYRINANRKNFELIKDLNYQGQRVQKVTIFNRDKSRIQVAGHQLRDARGDVICSAEITDVANVGGVMLPRKIVMHYRAEGLTIKLKLFDDVRDVVINQPIDAEQSRSLFSRPTYAGVQTVDLGVLSGVSNQVRPAGGFAPQR
ncbi:MAG TPA: hypothetical protein VGY58_07180 [Gemmataceae bacterium]|jgi:hypothetical protein|nr:hypothetical protein [Gemmataceae bacterium]